MRRVLCTIAVMLCSALVPAIAVAQAPGDSVSSSTADSGRVVAQATSPTAWPWRQVRVTPGPEALVDLQSLLSTRSRVRVSGDFGQTDLSNLHLTSAGLGGAGTSRSRHGQAADSVLTIPWPDIRSIEVGTRGWGKGAGVGTVVGAAPGLVLISGAFDVSTPPALAPFMLVIGIPLAAAGAVGGCMVGTLIGGGIVSYRTIYSSPVVSIRADPAQLPVRTIAVGRILENGKQPRKPTGVTAAVAATLESAGFRVVEADALLAIASGGKRQRGAGASDSGPYPGPVLDRIREQTGADAVISGWITSGRAGGGRCQCSFQMIHTRTHEVFMTSEMTAAYPGAFESVGKERVVREALGHLDALRETAIAPGDDSH